MQFTKTNFHQGDTQWFGITAIPSDAKKLEKKQYVAASEKSGSFHGLFGNYEMYEYGSGFIVDVKEECILNHSLQEVLKGTGVSLDTKEVLPPKDHRHTVVPKGIYFSGIQQKFDPLKGLKEKNAD